ncbi:MAG: hypothetical protein FWF94_04545 [Oscillospiraceae bacterium]|nr:hypothetical protein [Oscillospiraceae bacterium]
MSKLDDKRELLKLKQGLISSEESSFSSDERPDAPILTGKAALSNFVYHYSLHLKIASFFLIIGGIFAFFILTAEKYDLTVMLIADNSEASAYFALNSDKLKTALEQYTPDFDGNGRVNVECRFIDLTTDVAGVQRSPDSVQGNMIKLFGEINMGNSLIFIGNKEVLENIPGEEMKFEDFYCAFYPFDSTSLNLDAPDDLYIAVRNSSDEEALLKAMTVFGSIMGTGF